MLNIYCPVCEDTYQSAYDGGTADDGWCATWDDCPRCGWVPSPDDIVAALANEVPDYD